MEDVGAVWIILIIALIVIGIGLYAIIVDAIKTASNKTSNKTAASHTCTNYTTVWVVCWKTVCQYRVPRC